MISGKARFAVVALLLTITGLFLLTRTHGVIPPRPSLASFPSQMGSFVGTDILIPRDTLNVLGPGEFLQRVYEDQSASGPEEYLYLAYFPNQHAGNRRHLPEDCLAGSGWSPLETGVITLSLPGHAPFSANRYLVGKGPDRQLVLFWYWAHGRRVASEDWADFYLVLDSLRVNRTDDAMIRINTPLMPNEDPNEAQQRLLAFAAQANPLLNRYIPQ